MADATLSPALVEALHKLTAICNSRNLDYALIGGLATGHRSRPRATDDIDLVISVPQLRLPGVLDELVEAGFTIDVQKTIVDYVQHHITNFAYGDVRIDWLKPLLPIYQHVVDRSKSDEFMGRSMRVASAEGLILLKLIAGRPQDRADICSLLASNRGELDLEYIEREWLTIFPTTDERWQWYQTAIAEYFVV